MSMSKNTVFCLGLLLIVIFVSFINIKEGGLFTDLDEDMKSAYDGASSDVRSAYDGASADANSAYDYVTGTNTPDPQPASNSSLLPDSSDTKSQPADATTQVKKTKHKGHLEKHNNSYSSYIAPAGDTVLYNKQPTQPKKPIQPIQPIQPTKPIIPPPTIPKHQIPRGDEDLYILKSEIVPPVCPVCPNLVSRPDTNSSKPPPCPPCGRCTEPAFECKKVPNYNSGNHEQDNFLPHPVLNNFSQVGM